MATHPMSRFETFIGVWNTVGEVLDAAGRPVGTLVATDTYRWLPGRHFIVHDVDARLDGKPTRSMEVMGHDAATRRHVARSYDDQGATGLYVVTLKGRRWSIDGDTQRFRGSFDASHDRLAGEWELKDGRRGWRPWMSMVLTRA